MADERKNFEDMSETEVASFLYEQWLERGEEFAMEQAKDVKRFLDEQKRVKEQAEAAEGQSVYIRMWAEFRKKRTKLGGSPARGFSPCVRRHIQPVL